MAENKFDNRLNILSEIFVHHRDNKELSDFIEYNDLGLPLAFCGAEDLARLTEMGKTLVNETYDLLLASLEKEDGDFESLDDLMLG